MLPELPELPAFESIRLPRVPDLSTVMDPRMPGKQVVRGTGGRAKEAEELAAEMGTAFAYSKAQKKAGKQRAKATERRKTQAAERRPKEDSDRAKRYSTARRRGAARLFLNEARRLGLGTKLYKTARL